jgi:hypothetical protein
MPLLLLGFRDEFTGRAWQPPAQHWPGSPLIGGRDEEAGGTWIALHPDVPRVSCLLNGRGQRAEPAMRRSRGELPLLAAGSGHTSLKQLQDDPATLACYDPFILLCADLTSAQMLSWDGARALLADLGPGTHVITNSGHTYPPAADGAAQYDTAQGVAAHQGIVQLDSSTPEDAARAASAPASTTQASSASASTAKADGARDVLPPDTKGPHFGPRFGAYRPEADPAATMAGAWGDWLTLARGDGLPGDDSSAIIARRDLPDGRLWGTTSVSLIALGPGDLRYDFQPVPADPASWFSVGVR